MTLLVVFAAATAVAALGVPSARRASIRFGWLDEAASRSAHVGAVPRCGGLGVAAAALLVLAVTAVVWSGRAELDRLLPVAVGAAALAVVGFVDDVRGVRPLTRLVLQVAVATCLVLAVFGVDDGWASALTVVGVIAVVGYVNAFNFMDGINGIAAAQAVIAGVFFAVLGHLRDLDDVAVGGALLAGAFVGFVPFNAPRASVFLGDVGSYFAGLWVVGLVALAIDGGVTVPVAIAPTVLYLVDTGSTLLIRLRRGDTLFEAHRDHAYQRLSRRWQSHGTVVVLAGGVIAVSSGAALIVHDGDPAATWSVAAVGAVLAFLFVALGRVTPEPQTAASA